MANPKPPACARVKIRVLCDLNGVFPQYQPVVGKIYDADYRRGSTIRSNRHSSFCAIDVNGKKIVLRENEFELVEV